MTTASPPPLAGLRRLAAPARREALRLGLRARLPRPDRFSAGRPLIVGYLSSPLGLGEGARLMRRALGQSGHASSVFDASPSLGLPGGVEVPPAPPDDGRGPVILHVNPPELPHVLFRLRRTCPQRLAGRRLIGVWAWERSVLPGDWRRAALLLDEVWALSPFNADTFADAIKPPVALTGYPIGMAPREGAAGRDWRRALGLGDAFCVLTTADLHSSFTRKNPKGAAEAFRRAFAGSQNAVLVVKVSRTTPEDARARLGVAPDDPRVRVVAERLDEADDAALLSASNCVLSLHRAEGYGLLGARALASGRPAVLTAYSGVMAYADSPLFAGVRHTFVPVRDADEVYADGTDVWAEPDLDHAAALLRRVAARDEAARQVGAREARAWWREHHGAAAFVRRIPAATRDLMAKGHA